jgi:hypothetical protein
MHSALTRARLGTMLDDSIGIVAQHPAVTLVTGLGAAGLGAAGLGVLPLLLAIGRGRFGRGARRLLWPLQTQHHLILSLSKDRSALRGSAVQGRCGPSHERISETRPAQGRG